MHPIGILFTLISSAFLFSLPRHLAAIPLLLGATYMTRGQELEIGPAHFPVLRILVTVGFIRVIAKGEKMCGGINGMDKLFFSWAICLIGTSAFHTSDAWIFRIGMVWTEIGCYFLFRVFIQNVEDTIRIYKLICIALIPVTILMLLEKITGKNYFFILGGVNPVAALRDGHFRAQGPFVHAILAGTVGAGCFPMALFLIKKYRKPGIVGLFSAGGIVVAATSSGPIMMVFFVLFGMLLWKVKKNLSLIRWLSVLAIIALDAVMKDPVYYLMARIDLGGGSKGYHRARLIESSINHLQEWWLAGTDYTRHWMATGVHSNQIHTDITNHFLFMGILGGFPLMLLFIAMLVAAFRSVGAALTKNENAPFEQKFLIWTLGAILFGHVANFFSISYFDQSITYFYLVLASINSIKLSQIRSDVVASESPVRSFEYSRYALPIRKSDKKRITKSINRPSAGLAESEKISSNVQTYVHF